MKDSQVPKLVIAGILGDTTFRIVSSTKWDPGAEFMHLRAAGPVDARISRNHVRAREMSGGVRIRS